MIQHITHKLGTGIKVWLRDEAGNTTIDWVVLVSGILGMTFLVMASIGGGMQVFGEKAEAELTQREIGF